MKLFLLFSTFLVLVYCQLDKYLGIKPTEGKWTNAKAWYHYSSVATFKDTDIISEEDQIMLAKQAFKEMREIQDSLQLIPKYRTNVMTALRVGQTIYFASSMKNAAAVTSTRSFGYGIADDRVKDALERCQHALFTVEDPVGTFNTPEADKNNEHRNQANCGEILAVQQWNQQHPNEDLREYGENDPNLLKKIVSVDSDRENGKIRLKDPCEIIDKESHTEDDPRLLRILKWGCEAFVPSVGVEAIIRPDSDKYVDFKEPEFRPEISYVVLC